MGRLTSAVFNESCCDGGSVANAQSAQPCGCDAGAGHLCERHANLPPTTAEKFWSVASLLDQRTIDLGTIPIGVRDVQTNPALERVLVQMREMHAKKNHDYASDNNQFSNFEEAAAFAGCDVEMVFRVMIGIKIARLKELQASGKTPNNESLEDSQFDLMMYCALQRAYKER